MWQDSDDPSRRQLLEEMQRLALETYGEERAGEGTLQMALRQAATAVWQVSQESLEPSDTQP